MQFYLLLGFAVLSLAFLLMLTVQFLSIEKTVSDLTDRTEIFVKKIYAKGQTGGAL
jgi:hypothetical protein